MRLPGTLIWFYNHHGLHSGIIEKTNKKSINVLEEDNATPEGYQLWRIEEFFVADSPEEAKLRWDEYKKKLREYRRVLNSRRRLYDYERGFKVVVNSLTGSNYTGTVIKLNKTTLYIYRDDGKLMRVDRAICSPTT